MSGVELMFQKDDSTSNYVDEDYVVVRRQVHSEGLAKQLCRRRNKRNRNNSHAKANSPLAGATLAKRKKRGNCPVV